MSDEVYILRMPPLWPPPSSTRGVTSLSHRSHLSCFLHVYHTNPLSFLFSFSPCILSFLICYTSTNNHFIPSTDLYLLLGKALATPWLITAHDLHHLALLVYLQQWWLPPAVDPPFLRLTPLTILFLLHLYLTKSSLPGLPFSPSLALGRGRTRMRRRCFLPLPMLMRVFSPLCLV